MLNAINILKAVLICALLNGVHTFFVSTSAFQEHFRVSGEGEFGRFEAFLAASKSINEFWPNVLKGWATGFGLSFVSCVLLMLWLSKRNT